MENIRLEAIRDAQVHHEPYDFLLGSDMLPADRIEALSQDFPDLRKQGYLTVDDVPMSERFRAFIAELEGPELTEALSKRFGLDLHPYPRITTIMKRSHPKHGAIHTDGESKVMTMLVYMNEDWATDSGGRLRVLHNGTDFEPYAMEVPPTMGTVFAFLRADNSWHGHKPFDGERRVVQVAWIKSQEDLDRKRKNNKMAQFLKGIFRR
ncbi:MAG: hypothetical protein AcusKO_38060 [Acuticoccus sp.]